MLCPDWLGGRKRPPRFRGRPRAAKFSAMETKSNSAAAEELSAPLARLGLLRPEEPAQFRPLTGGVASDIWLVEARQRVFVVKRALAKLKVAADWRAPLSRNAAEAAWLRQAGRAVPSAAPAILAEDREAGLFAMTYLPPDAYPVWKARLRRGDADPAFAGAVGRTSWRSFTPPPSGSIPLTSTPTRYSWRCGSSPT